MGEAKRSGDYEKRKSEAINSGRKKLKKISKQELAKTRFHILKELLREKPYDVIG